MDRSELKELLLKHAANEIKLSHFKPEAHLELRAGRIGGRPAVPEGFKWPYYTTNDGERLPLSFLAQIDLGEASKLDGEGVLPKSGLLSFFYELQTMTWGFLPGDRGSARVYWFPEGTALVPAEFPEELDDPLILPERETALCRKLCPPPFEYLDRAGFDPDDYFKCMAELGYDVDEEMNSTKLLGYPDIIQDDMRVECEMTARGISCGNPADIADFSEDELREIAERAGDWRLLFQMGSAEYDDFELMFGDLGNIYFWIRSDDLEARRFENAWLVLQCG